jgi:dienelactone hydrolase
VSLTAVFAAVSALLAPTGKWSGNYTLPRGAQPAAISVELRGENAIVTLAPGHAVSTQVRARAAPGRLRFSLPGRPAPVAFDGRLRRAVLSGTVRQGALRGTFALRRGTPLAARELGLYALTDGTQMVVWEGFGTRLAANFETGEIHGLRRSSPGVYTIGAGLTDFTPAGTARLDGSTLTWALNGGQSVTGRKIQLRQEEVRVASPPGSLACTLTLPREIGRSPSVALVHGSGVAPRTIVGLYAGFYAHAGVAVLACDKRGNGQSSGPYPGERASTTAIDRYARDAAATARFLGRQPELDPGRVGLSGGSQAGWIMPLAASRDPAVHWLHLFVSPAVTVDESDFYADLTTQGASIPPLSPDEIDDRVRTHGPGGFDPLPAIRALRIPALWIYGGLDQHIPTRLSIERLGPTAFEPGRDFTVALYSKANHSLLETEHGLNAETSRSHQMAGSLFAQLHDWLRAHALARPGHATQRHVTKSRVR